MRAVEKIKNNIEVRISKIENEENIELDPNFFLRKFLWLFNPKYAILEVCLNKSVPMIVSSPDIPFEMVLAPNIKNDGD